MDRCYRLSIMSNRGRGANRRPLRDGGWTSRGPVGSGHGRAWPSRDKTVTEPRCAVGFGHVDGRLYGVRFDRVVVRGRWGVVVKPDGGRNRSRAVLSGAWGDERSRCVSTPMASLVRLGGYRSCVSEVPRNPGPSWATAPAAIPRRIGAMLIVADAARPAMRGVGGVAPRARCSASRPGADAGEDIEGAGLVLIARGAARS